MNRLEKIALLDKAFNLGDLSGIRSSAKLPVKIIMFGDDDTGVKRIGGFERLGDTNEINPYNKNDEIHWNFTDAEKELVISELKTKYREIIIISME